MALIQLQLGLPIQVASAQGPQRKGSHYPERFPDPARSWLPGPRKPCASLAHRRFRNWKQTGPAGANKGSLVGGHTRLHMRMVV